MNPLLLTISIIAVIIIALFLVDHFVYHESERQKAIAKTEKRSFTKLPIVIFYKKYHHIFTKITTYGFLTAFCLLALFPFFWMISSSLKTPMEAVSVDELVIFPVQAQWANYGRVMEVMNIFNGIKNTLIVEVATIPISLFVSALVAFAFAKMRMRHKNAFLLVLLGGMMVPYASLLLPQFRGYFELGLVNTLWPLIIPAFFGNVSIMFFFIQYMKSIPNELFEAAKIDGASYFKTFLYIMLPLMGPALSVQAIFMFVGNWNDFFGPSIYLSVESVKTLQVLLQSLATSGTDRPLLFAGAFMTCIPLFIIYFVFQRHFVGTIAISGIKG